jgi:Gpi18-like mannosyltransferase
MKRKYIWLIAILTSSLIFGAILLRGQYPNRTYFQVGSFSDITQIKAYRMYQNQSGEKTLVECNVFEKRDGEKLVLKIEPPANMIHMYLRQRVFDSKPSLLSLQISVNGSQDFVYTLSVNTINITEALEKLNATEKLSNVEIIKTATINNRIAYHHLGKWTLDSESGLLKLANLQVHEGKKLEYEGREWVEFIEILVTDFHSNTERPKNFIEHVEIRNLAFVYEKEGREPSQEKSFDQGFYFLSVYFLSILFILPMMFLGNRGKYSLRSILILGLLLRISIAPFTSHNFDVLGCKRAVRVFYEEGELSLFYSWTSPPLWFFVLLISHAPYIVLRKVGLPDFRVYFQPILAVEVLFIKLPLILSDLASAYLIYRICEKIKVKEAQAKLAATIFAFNPLSIFFSSIWGMFDSLAVVFMLLGLYFLIGKKFFLTSLIWGLGVKWYTLGFIPFLSIATYLLTNKEMKKSERMLKAVLIFILGFGTFILLMTAPHILYGDTSYLKQILAFRLKVGGGGEDRASLTTFFGPVVWRVFEHLKLIHAVPNFFLYTFTPLYILLLGAFYFKLKKEKSASDFFPTFNDIIIGVLLIFYLTYPQLTPQCILWILPSIIFAFVTHKYSVFPLIAVSLFVIPYLDLTYFIIGFSVPFAPFSVKMMSIPLECMVAIVLLPVIVHFLLSKLCWKCYLRISKICKALIGQPQGHRGYILYFGVNFFIFAQLLAIYTLNISSFLLAILLVITIFLQHIIFFALEDNKL